jgi:hypothetical protein
MNAYPTPTTKSGIDADARYFERLHDEADGAGKGEQPNPDLQREGETHDLQLRRRAAEDGQGDVGEQDRGNDGGGELHAAGEDVPRRFHQRQEAAVESQRCSQRKDGKAAGDGIDHEQVSAGDVGC